LWADPNGVADIRNNFSPANPNQSLILDSSDDMIVATAAPVPEPSAFVLLGMGAVSFIAWRRRR
jgi:hypothetical protein